MHVLIAEYFVPPTLQYNMYNIRLMKTTPADTAATELQNDK